ncbi:MAG: MBL fold metallo-hydrolase [Candidatus Thorarchaeota archaeon]
MTELPRITFLGQSCFFIEAADTRILLDPQNKQVGEMDGDIVYCTHSHFDHTRGAKPFLSRNSEAILLGNEQVTSGFLEFGERVKTVTEGETFDFKSSAFTFKRLRHGFFKGVHNLAVEVRIGGFVFAHCGDAVSFDGFPTTQVDVLAIPISGGFAAGPKTALEMIKNLVDPLPTVVPMHWLMRNPKSFCKNLRNIRPEVNCVVPSDGEPLKGYE